MAERTAEENTATDFIPDWSGERRMFAYAAAEQGGDPRAVLAPGDINEAVVAELESRAMAIRLEDRITPIAPTNIDQGSKNIYENNGDKLPNAYPDCTDLFLNGDDSEGVELKHTSIKYATTPDAIPDNFSSDISTTPEMIVTALDVAYHSMEVQKSEDKKGRTVVTMSLDYGETAEDIKIVAGPNGEDRIYVKRLKPVGPSQKMRNVYVRTDLASLENDRIIQKKRQYLDRFDAFRKGTDDEAGLPPFDGVTSDIAEFAQKIGVSYTDLWMDPYVDEGRVRHVQIYVKNAGNKNACFFFYGNGECKVYESYHREVKGDVDEMVVYGHIETSREGLVASGNPTALTFRRFCLDTGISSQSQVEERRQLIVSLKNDEGNGGRVMEIRVGQKVFRHKMGQKDAEGYDRWSLVDGEREVFISKANRYKLVTENFGRQIEETVSPKSVQTEVEVRPLASTQLPRFEIRPLSPERSREIMDAAIARERKGFDGWLNRQPWYQPEPTTATNSSLESAVTASEPALEASGGQQTNSQMSLLKRAKEASKKAFGKLLNVFS